MSRPQEAAQRAKLGDRVRYFDIANQNRYGTVVRVRTDAERRSVTPNGIELPDLPRYDILWDDGDLGGCDDRDFERKGGGTYTLNPEEE